MEYKEKSCSFTGHREEKLPWRDNEQDSRCQRLKAMLADAVESVYQGGVRHFICGMATGCDTYFCEAVMALRATHGEVTLEAAIPWEGQSARWSPQQKARYHRLVADCDFHTLVQKDFSPDCLMKRNRYMVDSSAVIIAASAGRPGGTMSTMLYAIRQGLTLIELPIE